MKKFILLFTFMAIALVSKAQTDLIISEYVEGWSTNKALEIFNPTNSPINLGNYRVVRYSNGVDIPPADLAWTFLLPNRNLLPYHSYVVVGDKRDPLGTGQEAPVWAQLQQRADTFACPIYNESKTMYFNGNDAVVLEKKSGADWLYVDIFARWGAPAPALADIPGSTLQIEAWTNVSPYFSGVGVALTADHTLIRKSSVKDGIKLNPTLFNALAEWDTLKANTFDNLGWHKFDGAPASETPSLNRSRTVYYVSPTAEQGASLGFVSATDPETDPVRMYIDFGNFVYKPSGNPLVPDKRYEPFGLNRNTGELFVADKLGLLPAIKSVFYLETTVNDGFSQSLPEYIYVIISDAGPVSAININTAGGATAITSDLGSLQISFEVLPAVTFSPDFRYSFKVSDESVASIDANGLLTAIKNGTVNVIATAMDGSGVESSKEITISGQTLSIADQVSASMVLYPNPVEGNQFRISAAKNIKTVIITDVASREVYRKSLRSNLQTTEIELIQGTKGVYFVSVIFDDNSRGVSKLVVR